MPGQYLYHGTSDVFLDRIKQEGLCPPKASGEKLTYWEKIGRNVLWREDAVYTSPSMSTAWSLADQTVTSRGGKQVVISFYSGNFKKPAGCKIQRRGNEVNFLGCDCIPVKILGYQTLRPSIGELMNSERFKSPAGDWKRLVKK